jgi:3-oxoacyl-[acyl-carrier-protein] synthase II
VVASSAFGNLETVCRTVERIEAGGTAAASPLDLPNASPNVVAASVAICFGAGALNLMVTSGATAGADALALATRAIRAGRADRMIVVGAESLTAPVSALLAEVGVGTEALFEGAAALVLERGPRTGVLGYARVESAGGPGKGPERIALTSADGSLVTVQEPPAWAGLALGAAGVLQAVFAARAIAQGKAARAEIVTGGALGERTARAVLTAIH